MNGIKRGQVTVDSCKIRPLPGLKCVGMYVNASTSDSVMCEKCSVPCVKLHASASCVGLVLFRV